MANKILPLRAYFHSHHQTCDRCDVEVDYGHGPRHKCQTHRETAAGMFSYVLCAECSDLVKKKRKSVRENAYRRAMVRHAAKYSTNYAKFIASWYGMRPLRHLVEA